MNKEIKISFRIDEKLAEEIEKRRIAAGLSKDQTARRDLERYYFMLETSQA